MGDFTCEAKTKWETIPTTFQEKVINNVWCPHCARATTMVDFGGSTLIKALILRGFCITCRKSVVRVLELI